MDSEEEKEPTKGFKVEDRRRFSAEGELKPEHRGPEQTAQSTDTRSTAETAAAPAEGDRPTRSDEAQPFKSFAQGPSPAPEITFGTFVVGLSTQALMHLGELPDPQTNQPAQDLSAAQQLIDIIAMLKNKTRGNLDHDEQTMLEAILFELRMKYVERARH
jgi:hypothetical protein